MHRPHALYLWPGQTHFGYGVVERTGAEAKALGARHALLLADPGVVAAGLTEPVIDSLQKAGIAHTLHDQIVANPSAASVDAGADAFRAAGADIVISVGGGSSTDTGKGVRMLARTPERTIAEYSFLRAEPRPCPPAHAMPPLIALPTTAGTGAEVAPWGVITDLANLQKFGIGGPAVTPTIAILDPALTLSLPPFLTAATGMDALTHLIEAYVSTNHNPILDPMILDAVARVGRWLPVAVAQGGHTTAREEMLLGSLVGGIAISSKWLGGCHALAHPLSAVAGVQHGLANAIMLPHQMAYSLPGALERYARIGAALDPGRSDSTRKLAQAAVKAVARLRDDCGLPARLRDVGVTEAQLAVLGGYAIQDLNWQTNPRRMSEPVLAALYQEAW